MHSTRISGSVARMLRSLVLVLFCALFVAAQQSQPVTQLGMPFRNQMASAQEWKYFLLDVDAVIGSSMLPTDYLTFMVTPYSGDIDLFVSKNNFPQSTQCEDCWTSVSPHGDIISIQRSDARWPTSPAKFYIGLHARTPSRFSFNTWMTRSHIKLFDGEPQSSNIIRGFYTYFDYDLDTASNFTVAVTPVSGDPDIYVSTVNREPTSSNRTWMANDWGLDVIPIRTNDPNFVAPSPYYVGVYGFINSYFTVAVTKDLSYTLLVEAVPLANRVSQREYKYFKFYMSESGISLFINVNPIASRGDPDLYVKYDVSEPKPSNTNFDYAATASGSDTLTISNARSGWYYIAVYGWSPNVFQLTASTEYKNTLLYDGVAVNGGVRQGQYQYYKYFHGDQESGLQIVINIWGNCDIKMYLSRTNSHPQAESGKHDDVGSRIGYEVVHFYPASTPVGNIYIGAYGVSDCNFTITAVTNQSYTLLRDGEVSIFNRVPEGYYRYYILDITDTTQDVTITANPWRGEVDLYASQTIKYPKRSNSTWRSEAWRQDTIVITSDDPLRNYRVRYYIGVYGRTEGYFTLLAYQSNTTIQLSDGLPISGAVTAGKYRYYKFYNQNEGSININLELSDPSSSDANIYASMTNQHPNAYDTTWRSTKFGNDFLQIDWAPKGWVYIGVAGVMSTSSRITYTIQASVAYQFLIANRASIVSFTRANATTQFRSFVWSGCDNVLIAATLISGRTSLYVQTNWSLPATESSHNFFSHSWPGNAILVPKNDPAFKTGQWNIGVRSHSYTDSEYFLSLVCAGSGSIWANSAWINEGTPRLGIAPINGSINYMFRILSQQWNNVTDNYHIYVRILYGSMSVYVSQDWRVNPVQNHTWASHGPADRVIRLEKSKLLSGYVYISLVGTSMDRPTRFEISVSKENYPKFLGQDQPQLGYSAPNMYSYFRVLNQKMNPKDFKIYCEACGSHPPPTLYADPTNEKPVAGKAAFTSVVANRYVNTLDIKASSSADLYYIGAAGSTDGTFYSIYSTQNGDSRPIVTDNRIAGISRSNGQLALRIARSQAPPHLRDFTLVYNVYKTEVEIDANTGRPKYTFNMQTVCGIQFHSKMDGEIHQPERTVPTLEYLLDVDHSKVYMVGVIVHTGLGLASAYQPGWVVNGQFYLDFPGLNLFQVSAGFIIMLVVFTLFIGYLLVGSIINVIRGKRGLEVIPNVDFWKDLPFLVLDGFKVLLCCRSAESYTEFKDESSVNTSGFGSTAISSTDNQPAPTEDTKTETTKTAPPASSYGSI